MNKFTSIIVSLLLVLTLAVLSGTQGAVSAEPAHVTPTEEVTPTEKVYDKVTPTEEVTPTVSCTPTPTDVTVTPTATATPTVTEGPTATPTPKEEKKSEPTPTPGLGGVPEMAKTGSVSQTLMNLSGIFGMLSVAAGSIIYANKQRKATN